MKLNKKGIASSSIIIVILLVLLVGSVGYICYDKFIKADEVKPTPAEEVKKLSEEEVKKIYDTIVYEENNTIEYGLYYKEKVDSSNIMPFINLVLRNYVKEKGVSIKYFAYSDSATIVGVATADGGKALFEDLSESEGKISKENIINYTKEKYGVEVTKSQITDESYHRGTGRIKDFGDYILIGYIPAGGTDQTIHRSMTKYEQNGKALVIYDNAVVFTGSEGARNFNQYITHNSNDGLITFFDSTEDGTIVDANGNVIPDGSLETAFTNTINAILSDGRAGSYKHTFTLGEDNTYHWVSSEKIN